MTTNANLTLYNRVPGQDGDTLKMTHIYGVNWQDVQSINTGDKGPSKSTTQQTSTKVFIPRSSLDQVKDKEYVKPKAFLSKDDKGAFFTFRNEDIVVRGIVNQEITEEYREKDLREEYDDVMTIITMKDQDNGSYGMQHFELVVI